MTTETIETELPFSMDGMITVPRKQLQAIRNTFNLVEPETVLGDNVCFEMFYDESRETLLAVVQYETDGDIKYYIKDNILEGVSY